MSTTAADKRVAQLVTLLEEIQRSYAELGDVLDRKLTAVRRADTAGMAATTRRERFLVDRIGERDGMRRQVMVLLGQAWGIDGSAAEKMSVREVASRTTPALSDRLLALADATRAAMERVSHANRIIDVVGKSMAQHFRSVYDAMTTGLKQRDVYSRSGRPDNTVAVRVFEMTG